MLERLATIREIAESMGVAYQTLYERVRLKGIRPVRRVGATYLYDTAVIQQHFAAVDGRLYDLDEARKALASAGGQR